VTNTWSTGHDNVEDFFEHNFKTMAASSASAALRTVHFHNLLKTTSPLSAASLTIHRHLDESKQAFCSHCDFRVTISPQVTNDVACYLKCKQKYPNVQSTAKMIMESINSAIMIKAPSYTHAGFTIYNESSSYELPLSFKIHHIGENVTLVFGRVGSRDTTISTDDLASSSHTNSTHQVSMAAHDLVELFIQHPKGKFFIVAKSPASPEQILQGNMRFSSNADVV
jgi:hypothetical protein